MVRGHIIICGAPKCATTSLFRYLAAHPDVQGSSKKELNYFLSNNFELHAYEKHFLALSDGRYTLEASPAYVREAERAAPRIRATVPDAKLIFVFREPVARLYSYFQMESLQFDRVRPGFGFDDYAEMVIHGGETRRLACDPELARFILNGVDVGKYADVLKLYKQYFDAKNIYVLFQDELKHYPVQAMKGLCQFLDIDASFYDKFIFSRENKRIKPRSVRIYRLALKINSLLEPLLNNVPGSRSVLRRLHHAINAGGDEDQLCSDESRQALDRYYQRYNRELLLMLNEWPQRGRIPPWLEKLPNS